MASNSATPDLTRRQSSAVEIDGFVIPESVISGARDYAQQKGPAAGMEIDGFVIPDDVIAQAKESAPPPPAAPKPGLLARAFNSLKEDNPKPVDPAGMSAAPMGNAVDLRGNGLTGSQFKGSSGIVYGEASPPKVGQSVFERRSIPTDIKSPPLTDQEMQEGSIAPARLQQQKAIQAYGDTTRSPEARPFNAAQNIAQDVREFTKNPVARGAVAGISNLGQTGIGAVRLAADLVGADSVADFAKGASQSADTIGEGATQGLTGNDKLVGNVTNSIINSLPSVALGVVGGPALKTLFAQSALAEYNNGRDAGFDVGPSLARAGIYGFAEAIGERFGFPQQIKLLKGVTKGMPSGEVAKAFGEMLAKEIPGEQLTTLMQFMADKIGPAALSPNATLADYLVAAGETLKLTVAQTAVMGGGPATITSTRNELAGADRATARSAMSMAERAAKDAGFLRPTEQRKETFNRLDDYAAEHGLSPKAVEAAKQAAATKPLAEVPGFLKRFVQSLAGKGMFKGPVDDAALSILDTPAPASVEPAPSDAIDAAELLGTPLENRLGVTIEQPEGSTRRGVDKVGNPWESQITGADYGTLANPDGSRGLGVFIKSGTDPEYNGPVFVIDQTDPVTGKHDESKAVIGASTQAEAESIYVSNYPEGAVGIGAVTQLPMPAFKAWAASGEANKPLGVGSAAETTGDGTTGAPVSRRGDRGEQLRDQQPADIHVNAISANEESLGGLAPAGVRPGISGDNATLSTEKAAKETKAQEQKAALGPPEVTWNGVGKKGMLEHAAKQQTRDVAKRFPGLEWTVVPAPEFGGAMFKLEGRKPAIKTQRPGSSTVEPSPNKGSDAGSTPAPAAKQGKLTPIDDQRLQASETRAALEASRASIGWDQVGGKMIRSGAAEAGDGGMGGAVVGRTPWIGSDLWRNRPDKITEADANAAINNALAGKPMTERQKRFVRYALDRSASDEQARAEARAKAAADERRDAIGEDAWAEEQAERAAIMAENDFTETDAKALDDSDIPWFDEHPQDAAHEIAQATNQPSAQGRADEAGQDAAQGQDAPAETRSAAPGTVEGLTAERAIRQAAEGVDGRVIGSWYPITVTHSGRTQQFLSNIKRVTQDGKGPQAVSLGQIRDGRLLAGQPLKPLFYSYRLTRANELIEEGIPREPSDAEAARWRDAFAAPGTAEEGLTAPTAESLKAAADRATTATKADAAEQKRLADKARADAEVGEFTLTGSNSKADIAAAAGQRDIFSESSRPERSADTQKIIDTKKRIGTLEKLRACLNG